MFRKLNSFLVLNLFLFLLILNIGFSVDDSFKIYSPNYFGEEGNIYNDIHYLEDELLSIEFCTSLDSNNISFELNCDSGISKSLDLFKIMPSSKDKQCYFINYDLNSFNCDSFEMDLTYVNNKKIKKVSRTFVKQKQSKLINFILNKDINKLSPVDLSYFLIVNNDVESIHSKTSLNVYERLKLLRDNEDKCWPSSSCDITETSLILRNLKLAGFDSSSRLLDDGNYYLARNLISNDNNPLEFEFQVNNSFEEDSDDEIECIVTIDGDDEDYTLDEDDNLTIRDKSSELIKIECNETVENIRFILYNPNGNIRFEEDVDDTRSYFYTIDEFACIGEDDECDFDSSLDSLITYDSDLEDSNLVESYIESNMVEDDGERYLDVDNEFMNMGKYLYYISDDGILDYLKFYQNNDGSWSDGSKYDRLMDTAWSVLGVQLRGSSSENVDDGKKWIYYNEPLNGWGSIEKNSLAYMAIKEKIKPYLKINSINEIEDKINFEIFNPTIYNLKDIKIKFSDEINDYLSYTQDLGDLEGEDEINFSIIINDNFHGFLTGYLEISGVDAKNSKLELINIPVNIRGELPFEVQVENYSISEDNPIIYIGINPNMEVFNTKCSLKNPFSNKGLSYNITENTETIELKDEELKSGEFETSLDCEMDGTEFLFPLKFQVNISEPTFNFIDNEVIINSNDGFSVKVENLLDEKQILEVSVEGVASSFITPTENEKVIAPKDTRDIYFNISNPTLMESFGNLTSTILIKSDNGYSKKIPLKIQINSVQEESSNWLLYTIIFIVVFVIVIFLIRRYRELNSEVETHSEHEDEMYFDDMSFN